MQKLHIAEAKAQGYIIDECCNPPIAYKGPRFQPTALRQCFTPLESRLLMLVPFVQGVALDVASAHAETARQLLAAHVPAEVMPAG
jgi:hypothetical protein